MKYDHELLYLAAIMHDLSLIDEFAGSQPYELDGADAAKQFLLEQGVQETRIEIVWNAISSHTSSRGDGERTEPEIALLGFGVLDDITGARIEQIPAQKVKEVLEGVA
jgi:hypothetical protein